MDKYQDEMMQQNLNATGEKAASGFQSAVSGGEDLLRATANRTAEQYEAARAKFQEGMAQAKQRMAETQAMLTDRATYAADMTKSYVVANPWKSVAIIGSIGLLLGMLLSRSSSSSHHTHYHP